MVLSGLQDQLAPLKSWLFPRRVYLQLEDQAFTAMVLDADREAWLERVPLPEGLCVNGQPTAVEALGDLLGDLLVERGFPGARVKAVLPRSATAWQVIEWPDAVWPDEPELVVRQWQEALALPWPLQHADVWFSHLSGAPARSLMVAVQRDVLEAWIEVCAQAGVALDGIEAEPMCLWRAVQPQLLPCCGLQLLLQLRADQSWLLAIEQGQPLGEWPLPPADEPDQLEAALALWRQRYTPRACIVLGADLGRDQQLLSQMPAWLSCPLRLFAHSDGEPSLWGLAAAEQR